MSNLPTQFARMLWSICSDDICVWIARILLLFRGPRAGEIWQQRDDAIWWTDKISAKIVVAEVSSRDGYPMVQYLTLDGRVYYMPTSLVYKYYKRIG